MIGDLNKNCPCVRFKDSKNDENNKKKKMYKESVFSWNVSRVDKK